MSTENIEPIQTFFDGYHFRSRLEARYAVLFKYILTFGFGHGWELMKYEEEGYSFSENGRESRYLPDFHVQKVDAFIEICGVSNLNQVDKKKWQKMEGFVRASGRPLILLGDLRTCKTFRILCRSKHWDQPWMSSREKVFCCEGEFPFLEFSFDVGETPSGDPCDELRIVFRDLDEGRENERLIAVTVDHWRTSWQAIDLPSGFEIRKKHETAMDLAVEFALKARFEHGETPTDDEIRNSAFGSEVWAQTGGADGED